MRPSEVLYPDGTLGKVRYAKKPIVSGIGRVDGRSNIGNRTIMLRAGLSEEGQAYTLLHELLHQSLDPIKQAYPTDDLEETIVHTITENFGAIWKRNPNVMLWIHANLVDKVENTTE